jgi:hypothetical protein
VQDELTQQLDELRQQVQDIREAVNSLFETERRFKRLANVE